MECWASQRGMNKVSERQKRAYRTVTAASAWWAKHQQVTTIRWQSNSTSRDSLASPYEQRHPIDCAAQLLKLPAQCHPPGASGADG